MRKQKQKLGLFLLIISIIGFSFWLMPKTVSLNQVKFKTITGETINLSSLAGKPVMVTFWASDCTSCIAEIPELIKLSSQVQMIAVAMYYDPPNQVIEAVKHYHLPYPVALDPDAQLAKAFGNVKLTPTHVLIDQSGNVVKRSTGLLVSADWQAWLAKI